MLPASQQLSADLRRRNEVEGSFGAGKRKYSFGSHHGKLKHGYRDQRSLMVLHSVDVHSAVAERCCASFLSLFWARQTGTRLGLRNHARPMATLLALATGQLCGGYCGGAT